MKRMHIHVSVERLDDRIRFYSAVCDTAPVKTSDDYANWMLDDPRVNVAISTWPARPGVDHLGLQVDDDDELSDVRARLKAADIALFDEGETVCCYARSDKSWVADPTGLAWETCRTMEDVKLFAGGKPGTGGACCRPATEMAGGGTADRLAAGDR